MLIEEMGIEIKGVFGGRKKSRPKTRF